MSALAAVAAAAALLAAVPSAAPLTGSIALQDRTWVCDGPVDLASVSVTMSPAAAGPRRQEDAIHIQSGCTGSIGRIDVTTWVADGVKVATGAHDLVIGGGSIRCLAKAPVLHQDGIQVMGGARITFRGLTVDCGRPDASLINSNMFVNMAGMSTSPPEDVVCDGCVFGGGAAHTVSIQDAIRSGISNSTLCVAKFPSLTLAIGPQAVDPVDTGNTIVSCAAGALPPATAPPSTTPAPPSSPARPAGKLSLTTAAALVTYGRPATLSGTFAGISRRRVTVLARPFGAKTFAKVATVPTGAGGRWHLVVHPGAATVYLARSRATQSPTLLVRVRPRVAILRSGGVLIVRVFARRPLGGRGLYLQRWSGSRWTTAGRLVLRGRASPFVATSKAPPRVRLRVSVPAMPGYAGTTSSTLVVP